MEVVDLKKHEETIDRLISHSYRSSYMSNTKWEKLFSALDVENLTLNQVLLKRVGKDEPYKTYMPKKEDLEGIWVSEGKNDCNYFYKEIEWIELLNTAKPSNIPIQYYKQSIEEAHKIIITLGQFETEITSTGLRIYGYKT
jgi:hypothetical protein